MKKIILILLTISTFAFANVGKITAIKGEVYVQRAAEQKTATIGLILEIDDKIITKKKSKALILFNDNTSITIGKSSNMDIKSFVYDQKVASNNKAEFGFGQGVFRTITGKIGKLNKSKFKIKTSTASIGIRGTVFDVVVNDKGVPDVGVLDGAVALSFTKDMQNEFTDQEIVVGKGQSIVYDDQAPVGERFKVQDKPLPQTDQMNQEFETLSSEQEQNGEGQNEDKKKETTEKKEGKPEPKKKETTEKKTTDNQKNEVVKKEAAKQEPTPTEKQNNEEAPVENKDQGETLPPQENQKTQVVQQPEQKPVPIEDNIQPQEQLPPQEETPLVENVVELDNQGGVDDFSDVNVRGLDTEVRNFDTPDIVEVEDQNEDTDTPEENDPASPQTDETDTPTPTDAPEVTDTPDVTETPEVVDIADIPDTDTIDEAVQSVEEATEVIQETVAEDPIVVEPTPEEPVIENINHDPTLSVANSLSTNEDTAGSLSFTTNDIDNDTLTTSASAANGTVTIVNGEIQYTPNANFFGTDTISLSVDDGAGGVIEQTISINVTAVNDNPTLSVANSLSTNEDTAGSLSFTTNDIDNDTLTTSASAANGTV
ncbi:MAG: Ig-like domain-containing protein, partial [Campylobacterota bacterium]|nr:Ig-like domain-containing protein [Campylobacterota bacterium]